MRRVGVITDNATLVVGLSLQAHDIDVTRVTDVALLGGYDVALIDAVGEGPVADDIPPGPVVVVVTNGHGGPTGTVTIRRPYTLGALIHTLETVEHPPPPAPPDAETEHELAHEPVSPVEDRAAATVPSDDAAVVPEPPPPPASEPRGRQVDAVAVAAPLVVLPDVPPPASGPRPAPVLLAVPPRAQEDEPTPAPGPEPPAERRHPRDPIAQAVHNATELRRLLQEAPFLRSSARLANGICRVLVADLAADHVALWCLDGEVHDLLGSFGLSDSDLRLRPHRRHPMLQQVDASDGVILDNADVAGPLMLGMPGATSPTFAAVRVDLPEVPASLATVSGEHLPTDVLDRIEGFLSESIDGWRAATALGNLVADLSD